MLKHDWPPEQEIAKVATALAQMDDLDKKYINKLLERILKEKRVCENSKEKSQDKT